MQTLALIRRDHLAAALFDTGRLGAPASSQNWRVAGRTIPWRRR